MTPSEALEHFCQEIPTLGLVGTPHNIPQDSPYTINADVQLVCKYLMVYSSERIDRCYVEGGDLNKFSTLIKDLTDEDCQDILLKFMPKHVKRSKITQHLYVK